MQIQAIKSKLLPFTFIFCLFFSFSLSAKTHANVDKVAPIVVEVGQVTKSNIPQKINSLGSLSALKRVTVSAETAGRVAEINFKSGQSLSKGMPIVQLDNEQAQASYKVAVTQYHLALQKYNRSKNLVNEAISKQDFAVLQAAVATEGATVQSRLADLNEKQVTAPFSGVLGDFKVQVGDYVNAGDPLVILVNRDQLHVNYSFPEKEFPQLKTGQSVTVTTSAYPNKVFYGTVTFISPVISQSSRMISMQALINNSEGTLSPGMFVHVSQQVGTIQNALIVPTNAVNADIKGYYVFKVDGTKAVKTYLKVGLVMGAHTQVLSGLSLGDTIVVSGQQKLEDGSLIQIDHQKGA